MLEFWECFTSEKASQEVFESVRNFINNRDNSPTTHSCEIAYDGHIEQMIGYGLQLCYDLNELEADCCIRCIKYFQSLSDWREFLLQFVDAVHQHGEFKNESEWNHWSWEFVREHTN